MTDLEFARRQNEWPAWPQLPLKRYLGERPEFGVLHGNLRGDPKPEVERRNMYASAGGSSDLPYTYPTLEALFADGWLVD
jgi:hypothetical protein